MARKIDLSVIIPCFNEQYTISNVITKVLLNARLFLINVEIIAIDDGSSDGTKKEIFKHAKKFKNIIFIEHEKNLGFGAAYKSGIKKARGKFSVLIPGDDEANVKDTLSLFHNTRNVDMVIPFVVNVYARNIFRRFTSVLFVIIINISFFQFVRYYNGSVFYRTKFLKQLKINSEGFLFQAEIVTKFIKNRLIYSEVPYFIEQRSHGNTKAFKLKNILKLFMEYINLLLEIHFLKKKYRIERSGSMYYERNN